MPNNIGSSLASGTTAVNRKYKTSDTHPLRICAVPVGTKGGLIGLSSCPGKTVDNQSGNSRRDMAKDIAVLRTWATTDVLSLIVVQEFMELSVFTLPDALDSVGICWHHLPIADKQAPCKDFERLWNHLGKYFKTMLLDGGRLMIHCRGNLNRAETIAAKILIETGHAPQVAIETVRAIRGSNAIRAPEQIKYLLHASEDRADDSYNIFAFRAQSCRKIPQYQPPR